MSKRPNILYLFADQLRYDTLGCTGNRVVKTPNIDRLAREGMVMDNAFSCCPICGPYRGQLLTGRYSHANGVMDNEYRLRDGQTTIADALGRAGYRTGYVGKLHLGPGPYTKERRLGFEEMMANNCAHHYMDVKYYHNEEGPLAIEGYGPRGETELALEAIRRFREETPERPFAVFLGWGPPHSSRSKGGERDYGEYPREYDVYDPAAIELPENIPVPLRAYERREFADYYAMTTSLDDCVGRLYGELERMGVLDNTIVCFTSDHGDHLGARGFGKANYDWVAPEKRLAKATPYEESVHVPFVVRGPGMVPAGRRSEVFFNSVDVMPTLLGMCGVDVPSGVQGRDLSVAMRGEVLAHPPDSVYLQILGPGWPNRTTTVGLWRGVRNERYTYARWKFPVEKRVLFDRKSDPLEMKNLAGMKEYAEVEGMMEKRLKKWMEETGEPFETGRRLPATGMLDLGQQLISEQAYGMLPKEYAEAIARYKPAGLPAGE